MSHHITSHHITSHHITSYYTTPHKTPPHDTSQQATIPDFSAGDQDDLFAPPADPGQVGQAGVVTEGQGVVQPTTKAPDTPQEFSLFTTFIYVLSHLGIKQDERRGNKMKGGNVNMHENQ